MSSAGFPAAPQATGWPAPAAPARRRPSKGTLETRLGASILSKIAVVLLLLGTAWFLKWAFDNRWIGPAGRVAAGLAAGVGVNLWAGRFRRRHVVGSGQQLAGSTPQLAGFSYALRAVGSGILYLSLWASVQLYHLAPAAAVFAAMAGVTAWNAVTAWTQDSQLLAGYALLGAYLTPLLLWSGGDHEIFLFSYLLLLALVLLAWMRVKRWSPLLLGGQAATAALFIAWYVDFFQADQATLTLVFAVALWAAFALAPIFAAKAPLSADETATATASYGNVMAGVLAPLANGVFGALAVYSILADSGGRAWEPWWALGFAAAYLVLAQIKRELSALAAVHLGLAVAFFTAMIPLKATGHTILVEWMIEAMLLIQVSGWERLDHNCRAMLRGLGVAVLLLAAGGVLLQPWLIAGAAASLINADFLTALSAVAALAIALALVSRLRDGFTGLLSQAYVAAVCLLLLNVVLLVAMHRELDLWRKLDLLGAASEGVQAGSEPFHVNFAFSAWMMAQGAIMLSLGFWRRVALARWIGLVLLAATLIKLFALDMLHLGTGYRVVSYLGLGALLMAVSFAYQKDWLGLLALNQDDEGGPRSSKVRGGEGQA